MFDLVDMDGFQKQITLDNKRLFSTIDLVFWQQQFFLWDQNIFGEVWY